MPIFLGVVGIAYTPHKPAKKRKLCHCLCCAFLIVVVATFGDFFRLIRARARNFFGELKAPQGYWLHELMFLMLPKFSRASQHFWGTSFVF